MEGKRLGDCQTRKLMRVIEVIRKGGAAAQPSLTSAPNQSSPPETLPSFCGEGVAAARELTKKAVLGAEPVWGLNYSCPL